MASKEHAQRSRKFSHESIAPYFADTYNTHLSVVMGVTFGGWVYVFINSYVGVDPTTNVSNLFSDMVPVYQLGSLLIVLGFIGVTWHRYIIHNQYLAWRLDVWDTYIPLGFGVLEISLANFAVSSPLGFAIALSLTNLLGFAAYLKATSHLGSRHTQRIYFAHFTPDEYELGEQLRKSIRRFELSQSCIFFAGFVLFLCLALYIHYWQANEEFQWYLLFFSSSAGLWVYVTWDLTSHLSKDSEIKKLLR